MQGLIIAINIIGVLAISLSAYTAVIYHQVSKLDKERQSEFCNQHYKKILTLLIVNVIICAGSLGGYIALTIFSAESSVIVFPLISWFASDFSVIALSAFIISAKKKNKNGLNIMNMVSKDNEADYFKLHFKQVKFLSKKYYELVVSYFQKISIQDNKFFACASYKTSRAISRYWDQTPVLLRKFFVYDGFKFAKCGIYLPSEEKAHEIINDLILELKNEIASNDEWVENDTLPCVLYYIVRSAAIIRYPYGNLIPNGTKNYEAETAEDVAEEQRQHEEIERRRRLEEAENRSIFEQRQREEDERQKEEHSRWLAYFKNNNHALIEKYSYTVENLIDKLTSIYGNLFLQMFNQTNIPMASILVYPYKDLDTHYLKYAIKHDGLEFDQSKNEETNTKLQNVIALYVEKLKEEIHTNNEWADDNTLPLLIYKIIRNNIIKHYHDKYVSECGYDNLEELCKNVSEPIEEQEIVSDSTCDKTSNKILVANKIAAVWFIYYYIYENDVNLPFVETYKKLCLEMKSIIANQEAERLKNELFGSHKAEVKISEKETRYLSPIEKVDNMTGEEFELFMTQYFAEHGFKATHTPLSGDYGIDLILENDFVKIGVQAKCYSNKVTLSAIQEVVAGLRHYGLSSGMVVTNNYFQPSAIQLAKENNITLWDRNKLIEKLGQ